jgi:glycosyltransferase involved in cell wall biosynthesis
MNPHVDSEFLLLLSDNATGGAAVATCRLLEGLTDSGQRVEWWNFSPRTTLREGLQVQWLNPERKRPGLERIIKNFSPHFAEKMRRKRHRATFHHRIAQHPPRLINCHNIHSCGLNHDDLCALPPHIPLVWTLHDCWSFQPKAFEWWNAQLGMKEAICVDAPEATSKERRRAFFAARPDVVLVAPSYWLRDEARKQLPHLRIEHIPYAVCGETFYPHDPVAVRIELGLDQQKIWLATAATHAYNRKGLDILAAALHQIDCRGMGLLNWGQEPNLEWPADLEVRSMGSISDDSDLSRLYSAADIFICPSRSDNLPNTILESLSCGVPVIGSNTGGIPDMVRPGETGWLFESGDIDACALSIQQAIADRPLWPAIKLRCGEIAGTDYSPKTQAQAYLRLFSSLIAAP